MNESGSILVLIFGTLVFTIFAVFTILYIALHKRKQYLNEIEKTEMRHRFNNQLMSSRLEMQEQTLKHLSSELHDNVAQVLGIAKMQLHVLTDKVIDNPSKQIVNETATLLGDTIKDIRSLSHTMNGNYVLKAGLTECIEKDLKRISDATRIKCSFISTGELQQLSEDKELMLFRVIQECISNAVKHGEPYEINVSLSASADGIHVAIADDGKGFNTEDNNSKGLGLDNIRERISLLKGTVSISSEKDKGTTILLRIPAGDEKHA